MYCDATGRPIDNRFDSLDITIRWSGGAVADRETDVTLCAQAHQVPFDRHVANEYVGYLEADGRVAMIEEAGPSRIGYFGYETSDEEIHALIQTLETAVLPR